jgi:hypothetical protein
VILNAPPQPTSYAQVRTSVRIRRTTGASDPLSAGANVVCDSTIDGDLVVRHASTA